MADGIAPFMITMYKVPVTKSFNFVAHLKRKVWDFDNTSNVPLLSAVRYSLSPHPFHRLQISKEGLLLCLRQKRKGQ